MKEEKYIIRYYCNRCNYSWSSFLQDGYCPSCNSVGAGWNLYTHYKTAKSFSEVYRDAVEEIAYRIQRLFQEETILGESFDLGDSKEAWDRCLKAMQELERIAFNYKWEKMDIGELDLLLEEFCILVEDKIKKNKREGN